MISCYARNGMEFYALSTFVDMLNFGERPNQFSFSAAIQACSSPINANVGEMIFGLVIKTGYFESDVCVGCSLIDLFVKGNCDLESAVKLFEKMPERNSVTWTLLITRHAQLGHPRVGIELFVEMIISGFIPDQFTFSSVVSACAELGLLLLGQQLHSWVIKLSLCSDVGVGCSLLDMYAKCGADGSMEGSRKVFDRMPDHSVMSWTAIITGYVHNGGSDRAAVELYCRMITEGRVVPNEFTLSSLLKACGSLSDIKMGEQAHNHAVKLGLASINCVGNSLISMYSRAGNVEDALKSFEVLFYKNLISYDTNIEDTGIRVDAFTFASLLSGAATVGALGKGVEIHGRLVKSGFSLNQFVCNALISMYSRCGNIEAAFQVFDQMEYRNVISWTSIITGFAKHGLAKRALDTFDQMLESGIRPNEVTYIAVLSACSHVGMIDEGLKHFNSMNKEHGLSPRMEHYACIVDLLGRSGFLDKAVDVIKSMPFKADALIWRTLLGACQVRGNIELGRYAARMIIDQDPNDPAAYILLSNLHASMGQWQEVMEIRKNMKEKKLVKEGGYSWIETANQVHKFFVGDTSHPQAHAIYEELDQLIVKIKELGYVPNTEFVLHDVEEDRKERYLLQHSEKLAVAFGLINTYRSKPIRIFKNLRVCGDCHTAMKYISMATGREIVVRDSNRFHHFKDGGCSCNDYW